MIVERRSGRRREANISKIGGVCGGRAVASSFARDHVDKIKSRYLGLVVAL
jgi:hypothetical protein